VIVALPGHIAKFTTASYGCTVRRREIMGRAAIQPVILWDVHSPPNLVTFGGTLSARAVAQLADADPPASWEPIRELCSRVAFRLDGLVQCIVDGILEEIPSYTQANVPLEDLVASVSTNTGLMLLGIAERRGPHPAELSERGVVGSQRAQRGVPAEDVIQAFHIGYRELWNALAAEAAGCDPATSTLLLSAATTAWSWTHLITNAVADAHKEVMRSEQAFVERSSQRLLDLIRFGDTESEDAVELARSLALQPNGMFQAFLLRATPGECWRIRDKLSYVPGAHLTAMLNDSVVVVSQGADEPTIEHLARRLWPDIAIGIGVERRGLAGARLSIGDAEHALAASSTAGTSRFADEWFRALVVRSHDRLHSVLAPGVDAVNGNLHLAGTLRAYVDCGFSQQRAARRLGIHANTVAYRLRRWEDLTGWHLDTASGLLLALGSLELSDESARRSAVLS
jgi:hypothetical protein